MSGGYAAYAALPGVNWSTLKHMRVSPLEYQYQLTAERKDAAHFRIGRAAHTLVLEPDLFEARHPIFPGASRRGKAWDAFVADYKGEDPGDILIEREMELALGCAEAIRTNPEAMRNLHEGVTEHVITWADADTGFPCKGRCDSVNGHLVDLKSTASIDPRVFPGEAARLGYHGQLAFYLDGLTAMGVLDSGAKVPPVIVAVESEPPHDVVVWTIPDGTIDTGRCLYKRLLLRLAECQDTGIWPGVAPAPLSLVLPAWAVGELENEGADQPLTIGGVAMEA